MFSKSKIIFLFVMIFAFTAISGDLGVTSILASEKLSDSTNIESTIFNDFENFDKDIQLIRLCNDFGRLEQNEDIKFVHSGNKSLKVNPLGRRDISVNPYIMIPTFSSKFQDVKFSNFSKVDSISFWAYNAEEEAHEIGVALSRGDLKVNNSHKYRRDEVRKTTSEYYMLKPGWNFIKYEIHNDLLTLQEVDISEIFGVIIEFEYYGGHKIVDTPTIYVDEIKINYADSDKSSKFFKKIEKKVDANGHDYWMVADFERPEELYYLAYSTKYSCSASCQPVMRTAFAGDYGVKAKSGTQVYVLQQKAGDKAYGWPRINIAGDVMRNVFNAIGEDVKVHPENYVLKFDMFNTSDYTVKFEVDFEGKRTWSTIEVSPHQWASYSMNMGAVNNAQQSIIGWKQTPAGSEAILSGVERYTDNFGFVRLQWTRFYETSLEDRTILIDNIRVEKIK